MRISPPFAAGPAAGRVWLSIADLSWGGHQPGSHMLWPRCWAVRRRRTGRQWPQQHSSWSPKTRSKNYAIQTSFYSRCFFFFLRNPYSEGNYVFFPTNVLVKEFQYQIKVICPERRSNEKRFVHLICPALRRQLCSNYCRQ